MRKTGRIFIAEKRTFEASKEGQITCRSTAEEATFEADGLIYEAGMVD